MISTFTRQGTQEVFSTMAEMEVISNDSISDEIQPPVRLTGMTGNVSFTGKMNGALYLNFSENFSKSVASKILGVELTRLSQEEIWDVVGELTNMVTGNLKSKMTDQGFNCQLSIPNVILGKEIAIESTQSNIKLYNEFKVTGTNEIITVYVFARLESN